MPRKQAVAPVEHRVQGLVSRHRSAAAVPEQAEAVVEQLGGSTNAEGADATGGKLNSQCHSVELAADPCQDRRIKIAQRCTIAARRGALHKKLGSGVSERLHGSQFDTL